jgi:hypothetical protein
MFHSTEASIAAVLVLVAVGFALMQIGSVNVVLTSTPNQFGGISLEMNLLIFLIGSSVGDVIAGIYLKANQVFAESDTDAISASSIAFTILLNRSMSNRNGGIKEIEVPA